MNQLTRTSCDVPSLQFTRIVTDAVSRQCCWLIHQRLLEAGSPSVGPLKPRCTPGIVRYCAGRRHDRQFTSVSLPITVRVIADSAKRQASHCVSFAVLLGRGF